LELLRDWWRIVIEKFVWRVVDRFGWIHRTKRQSRVALFAMLRAKILSPPSNMILSALIFDPLSRSSRFRSHFAGRRRRSGCSGEPATEQNTQ